MWKAWIGFNASHSLGAVLFGQVYGYLVLAHAPMLLSSPFRLAVFRKRYALFNHAWRTHVCVAPND